MDRRTSDNIIFFVSALLLEIGLRMNKTGFIDVILHKSAWMHKSPLIPGCYPEHLITRLLLICGLWFLIDIIIKLIVRYMPIAVLLTVIYLALQQADAFAGNKKQSVLANIIMFPLKIIKNTIFGIYNWIDKSQPYFTSGLTIQSDGSVQILFVLGILFLIWALIYIPSCVMRKNY